MVNPIVVAIKEIAAHITQHGIRPVCLGNKSEQLAFIIRPMSCFVAVIQYSLYSREENILWTKPVILDPCQVDMKPQPAVSANDADPTPQCAMLPRQIRIDLTKQFRMFLFDAFTFLRIRPHHIANHHAMKDGIYLVT